jgi:Family of unknown function (DUF6338)
MEDKIIEKLFDAGGWVLVVSYLLPGFIAWRVTQMRRPSGEQKPADALITIVVYGVVNSLAWYWKPWTSFPTTWQDVSLFVAEFLLSPVVLAYLTSWVVDLASGFNWVTSPYPRAWEHLFNDKLRKLPPEHPLGFFLVVTLKGGEKIGGQYEKPGFASLYPYDRDLFLGHLWQLDEETAQPVSIITGSVGAYIDGADILTVEVLDFGTVVENAKERAKRGGE